MHCRQAEAEDQEVQSAMTHNDMLSLLHAMPTTMYARKHHFAVLPVHVQHLSVL